MNKLYKIFFSPKGRLGRLQYIIWGTVAGIMTFPLGYESAWSMIGLLYFAVLNFCYFNIISKRFHDLDMSEWYHLGFLVPFYNVYLMFKLLLIKGTPGHNRFGKDPLANC